MDWFFELQCRRRFGKNTITMAADLGADYPTIRQSGPAVRWLYHHPYATAVTTRGSGTAMAAKKPLAANGAAEFEVEASKAQ